MRERHRGPFLGDLSRSEIRIPGQPAKRIPVGLQKMMARPVSIRTSICHTRNPRQMLRVKTSFSHFRDGRPRTFRIGVGVENLTPHLGQKYKMIGKAEVLLSDLKLRHQLRFWHRAKQWMERLTRLKINRSVLYL